MSVACSRIYSAIVSKVKVSSVLGGVDKNVPVESGGVSASHIASTKRLIVSKVFYVLADSS